MPDIDQIRRKVDHAMANYTHARRQAEEEQQRLDEAKQLESNTLEAQGILQSIAEHVQQQAHEQIADIVSRCLEAVFGEDAYEFKIDFRQSRGKTEARLLFVRDGHEIEPMDASGGGVIDVAATGLRIACLVLTRPPCRRLLVLDEPWKHLSADYRPAMREIVQSLSKEMGVQFIIVTHSDEFTMGKVIRL